MNIYVTTGMPGAGKEEFLKCCEERGAKVIRMGDIVRARAKELGFDSSDSSVGTLANEDRHRYGKDVWAKRTIPFVGGKLVCIDGSRNPEEIEAFRKAFGEDLKVVAIHSSAKTRHERLKSRGRSDSPQTRAEFDVRDRRELSWGLGDVIALADFMITNESTVKELRKRICDLLDRTSE